MDLVLGITDAGTWLTAARVAGIVVIAYLLTLWVALVLWTVRDVQSRTRDQSTQVLCVALVAAFFIPGLLLYMALRPQETLTDSYNRQLEQEAFLQELEKQGRCSGCRRFVRDDFAVCPHCRTALKEACTACSRSLDPGWAICPFCTAERREPVPMARPAARTAGLAGGRGWRRPVDGVAPRPVGQT